MFVLGYLAANGAVDCGDYLKISNFSLAGTHAYIVFRKCYDRYLELHETKHPRPDQLLYMLPNVYASKVNLFIQYNNAGSLSFSKRGYIAPCGRRICTFDRPPSGFGLVEEIFGVEIHASKLLRIAREIGLVEHQKKRKCLVLGSNPCMLRYPLGQYINAFDGDVVAINRMPPSDLKSVVGSRVDFLFKCEIARPTSAPVEVVLPNRFMFEISSDYPKGLHKSWRLTSGFIFVLIASVLYDEVELFGFVDPSLIEDGVYRTIYNFSKKEDSNFGHDTAYEHALLKIMSKDHNKYHITLLESKFKDKFVSDSNVIRG